MATVYYYRSPLGQITLVADGGALVGLWLSGQQGLSSDLLEQTDELVSPDAVANQQVIAATRGWLDSYFAGDPLPAPPRLRLQGTDFRQEVWQQLQLIPYGETRSYGELAAQLAQRRGVARMSAQAIGGAVGQNPISIIVPCHRVVGANGALTGYNGGVRLKQWLLEHEQQVLRG